MVRILIEREKGLKIEGFDLVLSKVNSSEKPIHVDKKSFLRLNCSIGTKIQLEINGKKTLNTQGPLRIESLGGFIRVSERQYRDELYVYSSNKDCIVVNRVDLEKYIAGLLNSEMSAHWDSQALMAQAITARTYALYQMQGSPQVNPAFDLDSSVKDQVYEGAHKERYKALSAVQKTRGMILAFQGKPIKAFYHSTCGGNTEKPERVWGGKFPYLTSVRCPYCYNSPRFNWIYELSFSELEKLLRKATLIKKDFLSLKILKRNGLNRAEIIEISTRGEILRIPATKLRSLLGTSNIMSTNFYLSQNKNQITFIGHGSGHGVGMCQWGAKTMSEKGYTYTQILKHYYPQASVTKLY